MKKFRHILAVGIAATMLLGSVLDVSAAGLMDIFDAEYYADSYADLKEAFGYDEGQLYNHFITYGLKEGRNMSPILDVVAYREAYADLEAAFGDDWEAYVNHFLTFGAGEMRNQGVLFNPIIYADAYDDVKAAYGSDLMAIIRHYLIFGRAENRTIGTFNGYAGMAVAGKAAQGAQQVTPDGASAPASASETPGSDVLSGNALSVNAPSGNAPGSNTPGGNGGNSNKTSVIWTHKGEHIEYEYDERGNCISQTNYDDTGKKTGSTHFTFNSNNELVRSESRDEEGNCWGYNEYEYDGGKIKKIIYYDGNGKVSYSKTYEWNGNTVTISDYNEKSELIIYRVCETDSRLNFIREKRYSIKGELSSLYVCTYDENDNMLTRIGYIPDGTEVSNDSFTYYENGTKKTETNIKGGYKEIFEYNEKGSRVSYKAYSDDVLEEDKIYEYYAEGSLAMISCNRYYSDGDIQYTETDYDEQGRMQKETVMEEYSDGRSSMRVRECADDGSYTISSKSYGSDGNLTSKWSETYDAQDKKVNDTTYIYLDGNVESVIVEAYENGRIMKKSVYEADEVTPISAEVHTYVDTEYGYEETIEELNASGNVVRTYGYMCDENGDHLGSKNSASDGGTFVSWHKGKYKNQTWFYTAEGKLRRKEIKNGYNVMLAVYEYEYDADGNQTVFELVCVDGKWVRPSKGSGTGESGSSVSGNDAGSGSVSGNGTAGN